MDDQAENMQEDSPPPKAHSEIQEKINTAIYAELKHLINDHATAEILSSQCQELLAAAFTNDVIEPTLRALVRIGKDILASTAIPQFWDSVGLYGSWEPEDHAALVAALNNLVAVAQALHRKITYAVEFLKSQTAEHSKARVILLWAAPRVFFLEEGELIYQSEDLKSGSEGKSSSQDERVNFPTFFSNFYYAAITALSECEEAMPGSSSELTSHLQQATQALRTLGLWKMVDRLEAEAVKKYITSRMEGTLCELRTNSLFDLVIDYPESLPALQDLKQCLKNTRDGYQKLVGVFGSAIRTRLLHPGAATADIIHHYVSTIRALRHIDQSGTVLDLVSGSLREYLRTRRDAIRCIVTMITEDDSEGEGPGFLAELEAEGEGYDPDADFLGPDADKQALKEIEEDLWEPAPFTIPGRRSRRHRTVAPGDVVSMLVNIYGSKEMFVAEYRSMLADRLLAKMDFDCDRELRTLELLKVRFGEQALHPAEVMLRDVADSKRINANVRNMANNTTPLKSLQRDLVPLDSFGVTIVSELFWPQLAQNEEFKLPQSVQRMMRTFGHKYHALKAPRILKWKAGLGAVALTLTVADKDIKFNVSPLHAAILIKFEEHPEWAPAELAESLEITAESLRKKIVYWINQGVILEVRRGGGIGENLLYRRNEQLERPVGPSGDLNDVSMDVDDTTTPEVDPMSQYEPFVLGMLTNFDALGLDRIHNMLKMFVTDPPYDRTIEQLSGFFRKIIDRR
ncbi:hypothetical protein Ndes2526A_g06776 [Nannochloris sp. 'desiccata']